jgi:uncharacterized protein YdeI (YjbR/CyaY-like superfamily)
MAKLSDSPVLPFKSADVFARWVAKQAADSPGVWLKIAKKESGIATVTYQEALDVALCFGWIDGQKAGFDAQYFLQRFSPRARRSKWSKINCDKVEKLISAGAMKPGGQAQIDAAKADGRWQAAYAGSATIEVPEDLAAALRANKTALAFFDALDRSNRYAILFRVHEAKKPETRAARIAKFVGMCAAGETVHARKTKA